MNRMFDSVFLVLTGTVTASALGYFLILMFIKDPYLKAIMRGAKERMKILAGRNGK